MPPPAGVAWGGMGTCLGRWIEFRSAIGSWRIGIACVDNDILPVLVGLTVVLTDLAVVDDALAAGLVVVVVVPV